MRQNASVGPFTARPPTSGLTATQRTRRASSADRIAGTARIGQMLTYGFDGAITIDDRLYEVDKAARTFANTHIFPGGCLPSERLIGERSLSAWPILNFALWHHHWVLGNSLEETIERGGLSRQVVGLIRSLGGPTVPVDQLARALGRTTDDPDLSATLRLLAQHALVQRPVGPVQQALGAGEGLGDARRALVADPRCPVLVVHRGPLSPQDAERGSRRGIHGRSPDGDPPEPVRLPRGAVFEHRFDLGGDVFVAVRSRGARAAIVA